MDARAMRFECLHLAHEHYASRLGVTPAKVVAMAKAYHDYVMGEHKPVAQPRGADGRFVNTNNTKAAAAKTMADLVDRGQLTGDPAFDAETDRLWDEHVARTNKIDDSGEWLRGLTGPPNPNADVTAKESESSFIGRCFGRF